MTNIVWFSGQCDKTLHGLYPSTSAEPYPQRKYIKAMPCIVMTDLLCIASSS